VSSAQAPSTPFTGRAITSRSARDDAQRNREIRASPHVRLRLVSKVTSALSRRRLRRPHPQRGRNAGPSRATEHASGLYDPMRTCLRDTDRTDVKRFRRRLVSLRDAPTLVTELGASDRVGKPLLQYGRDTAPRRACTCCGHARPWRFVSPLALCRSHRWPCWDLSHRTQRWPPMSPQPAVAHRFR